MSYKIPYCWYYDPMISWCPWIICQDCLVPGSQGPHSLCTAECMVISLWCDAKRSITTRPGKHRKSYWKWPFIVDLPMKNGEFPELCGCLPEVPDFFKFYFWRNVIIRGIYIYIYIIRHQHQIFSDQPACVLFFLALRYWISFLSAKRGFKCRPFSPRKRGARSPLLEPEPGSVLGATYSGGFGHLDCCAIL